VFISYPRGHGNDSEYCLDIVVSLL
jgi:hypothetical protein